MKIEIVIGNFVENLVVTHTFLNSFFGLINLVVRFSDFSTKFES